MVTKEIFIVDNSNGNIVDKIRSIRNIIGYDNIHYLGLVTNSDIGLWEITSTEEQWKIIKTKFKVGNIFVI